MGSYRLLSEECGFDGWLVGLSSVENGFDVLSCREWLVVLSSVENGFKSVERTLF